MSQLPASLPTTLPPKCHPTWGTAPPPRPMWPEPHGSQPVAVLSLPTAVTSLPRCPLRAWRPTATPSTRSPPPRCEDRRGGRREERIRAACLLRLDFPSSSLWRTRVSRTHTPPNAPAASPLLHRRNKLKVNFRTGVLQDGRTAAPSFVNSLLSHSLLRLMPRGWGQTRGKV